MISPGTKTRRFPNSPGALVRARRAISSATRSASILESARGGGRGQKPEVTFWQVGPRRACGLTTSCAPDPLRDGSGLISLPTFCLDSQIAVAPFAKMRMDSVPRRCRSCPVFSRRTEERGIPIAQFYLRASPNPKRGAVPGRSPASLTSGPGRHRKGDPFQAEFSLINPTKGPGDRRHWSVRVRQQRDPAYLAEKTGKFCPQTRPPIAANCFHG